ncbi:MAG TPA: ATP-binding cassette domain-containing protein, partial [Inquilinus sp.]
MTSTETRGVRLQIDHVHKTFGPFEALRPVTVDIQPGEFVSVVGPSGCGKSTLMLMVAGLMKTSGGSIRIDGKPLSGPLTDVGIAFQDHLLLDFRTAFDNVLL